MCSRRRICLVLILTPLLLLIPGRSCRAQEVSAETQQVESDEEMYMRAEKEVRSATTKGLDWCGELNAAHRAEQQLKKILQLYPQTFWRERVEEDLSQVQEILGLHDLQFAQFYFDRGHGMKGAESRLQQIIKEYPNFSRTDEALLLLGKTYLVEERPEDAANFFWKLVCRFPASKHIGEAFEQLNQAGFGATKGCDNSGPE